MILPHDLPGVTAVTCRLQVNLKLTLNIDFRGPQSNDLTLKALKSRRTLTRLTNFVKTKTRLEFFLKPRNTELSILT